MEEEEERSRAMLALKREASYFFLFSDFVPLGAKHDTEVSLDLEWFVGGRRGERFIRSRLDTALQFRYRNCENRRA